MVFQLIVLVMVSVMVMIYEANGSNNLTVSQYHNNYNNNNFHLIGLIHQRNKGLNKSGRYGVRPFLNFTLVVDL